MIDSRTYIIFLIILTSFFSCKKEEKIVKQATHNSSIYDTVRLPALTGLKPNLRLTPKAKKITQNWRFYKEAAQYLDSLGQGTIGQNKHYTYLLDKAYTDLQGEQKEEALPIPSQLATQPIQARLTALETQIKVLKNEVDKANPSAHRIAASIVQSKNALQDLNLQIDERFALSIEEILEAVNETAGTLDSKDTEQTSLSKRDKN